MFILLTRIGEHAIARPSSDIIRSNARFIKIDIAVKHLENFRLELVHSPKVIMIQKHFIESYLNDDYYTKDYAEKLVEAIPHWIKLYYQK